MLAIKGEVADKTKECAALTSDLHAQEVRHKKVVNFNH